jgi:hypothetical protein
VKGPNRYRGTRAHPGGFVALPHPVIRSAQFACLSPNALKLLLDLLSQYRGDNNGDLCATWTVMKQRSWKSRSTLYKAQRELEGGRWIVRMRQGGRHAPNLFAVTFFTLDSSDKHTEPRSRYVSGAWQLVAPRTPPTRRKAAGASKNRHAQRVNTKGIDTTGVQGERDAAMH